MKTIKELTDSRIDQMAVSMKQMAENANKLEKAHAVLVGVSFFFDEPVLYHFDHRLIAEFTVPNIKEDGAKILGFIEHELGVEFSSSTDNGDQRWFSAKDFPLRVDLRVKPGSDTCRLVKVGEKMEDVFEIRCDD